MAQQGAALQNYNNELVKCKLVLLLLIKTKEIKRKQKL